MSGGAAVLEVSESPVSGSAMQDGGRQSLLYLFKFGFTLVNLPILGLPAFACPSISPSLLATTTTTLWLWSHGLRLESLQVFKHRDHRNPSCLVRLAVDRSS